MQAADCVDIATVLAADEDFELRIDGAGVFDERADHLLDGGMDGDERMTLEEFLVDVERQEAVGGGAGNGISSAAASKTTLICISGISGLVMAIRTER